MTLRSQFGHLPAAQNAGTITDVIDEVEQEALYRQTDGSEKERCSVVEAALKKHAAEARKFFADVCEGSD